MKLLIIGHSVVDHIFDDLSEKISPGGIYYSCIGFNVMKGNNDRTYLMTSYSEQDRKYFSELYSNFDLSYSNEIEQVPHVNLYVDGTAERREHYHTQIEPLKLAAEIDWNEFDGIYINMITGTDLTPEQFQVIRENFDGLIYMDVHTLSRGVGKDRHRFFRKIPGYQIYLNSVDIIQLNEHELKTITPYDDIEKIKDAVFSNGAKILIITKGDKGVETFENDGSHHSLDAIDVTSHNKVGCGDVFGSVFFYNYILIDDLEKSLMLANTAAGLTTTFHSTGELQKLNHDFIKGYIED